MFAVPVHVVSPQLLTYSVNTYFCCPFSGDMFVTVIDVGDVRTTLPLVPVGEQSVPPINPLTIDIPGTVIDSVSEPTFDDAVDGGLRLVKVAITLTGALTSEPGVDAPGARCNRETPPRRARTACRPPRLQAPQSPSR